MGSDARLRNHEPSVRQPVINVGRSILLPADWMTVKLVLLSK